MLSVTVLRTPLQLVVIVVRVRNGHQVTWLIILARSVIVVISIIFISRLPERSRVNLSDPKYSGFM